jgi:hypothetical protein
MFGITVSDECDTVVRTLCTGDIPYQQGRHLPMGQPGQSEKLAPPPIHKYLQKKCEALLYCDSNEFIGLAVGTSRVLMSKAPTNKICSNKHKAQREYT